MQALILRWSVLPERWLQLRLTFAKDLDKVGEDALPRIIPRSASGRSIILLDITRLRLKRTPEIRYNLSARHSAHARVRARVCAHYG